jgi:hypothetical protein
MQVAMPKKQESWPIDTPLGDFTPDNRNHINKNHAKYEHACFLKCELS